MGTNIDEFYDKSTASSQNVNNNISSDNKYSQNQNFSGNIDSDLQQLKEILGGSTDIIYREFQFGNIRKAVLIFIDGFVDTNSIDTNVLQPLINYRGELIRDRNIFISEMANFIQSQIITVSSVNTSNNIQDTVDNVVSGNCALLIDGEKHPLIIDLKKFDKRSVEEPRVEAIVRGPREGFTENLSTNIILVRRRLKTPKLKVDTSSYGRLSKTSVSILYIEGVAKDTLIQEVKKRISEIDVDVMHGSAMIEEIIEDDRFSIFSQFGVTERPDRFASNLSEGHVGIIVDGTPMALLAPGTFIDTMKATEDYYDRYILSSLLSIMRYIFLFMSIFLPGFYIALVSFHQGMIPRPLLLTIAASREGVPFPSFVELFIMQIFFEGLQEASTRLPRIAGQTVSIVGGLAIGQAAIQAGIVSASTVVVVTVTGISTFVIPRQSLVASVRILRFPMLFLASVLGLYGIFIGTFFTLIHMAKLRSFGIPFLSPIAPLKLRDLKDSFVRSPWWTMTFRPDFVENKNSKRMKKNSRSNSSKYNN
ncbi:spore germination protein KA [Clostridium pasteurianum DSM 525 = ATCC 6013]|uniref:GerA spore germination protein n=1 Tax=Clostridium pasteurianum DSM 525 = ATCC 6013 TaxID=1262449 RepID=A0A0H3J839_CLOPA|nr:spore germination protein [Clostridium pasteurianum]AJA47185.1 spore germination protein KA [Clostridium pasteurianum DSM 525 = ATCC 6013]AJA51173.1 spore germination protein KA [Clostridium pasteurianum DSM 525 = ATCC 6013]AOZ74541.1 hypothetical protein AQ983_05255 [Clostridium pasteurianum DSM 525 = ATCC 6013]AOZ78338.1 hypothetical protein AQ984_05245 [Clostridium pasteurianum]ELP59429.1 spore germination protein KA [Clostridium pasteurianum DSM 525 = ATCC 6013]